jgi:hypothetical protein
MIFARLTIPFCSGDGFGCSAEGILCSIGGLIESIDGLICSVDGFVCSADGFICSAHARNWWVDAISSIRAVNITFRLAPATNAEPGFCWDGAKLSVAGPGKYSLLPNFVANAASRTFDGAKKTVDRVNKTIRGRRVSAMLGQIAPDDGK